MAYTKLRFTDEQIEQANNVSILDYAISRGFTPKKVGTNSYKIEGHGGLLINPQTNKWNCFSERAGGGPIQFIMFLQGKTWVESVKELLENYSENNFIHIPKEEKHYETKEFSLPEKNNTYKHMMAYLIKTRKIDQEIVKSLVKEGKLYEDYRRNCVFVGHDQEGKPRYANLRGTNTNRTPFKGEAKNSDKTFSFNIQGNTNTVYIFESPIEALSYLTLHKKYNLDKSFNHHVLSLGGVSDVALEHYIKRNSNIDKIIICLNNDEAGIKATRTIQSKYQHSMKTAFHLPQGKDFNEDLQEVDRKIEKERAKEEIEEEWELEL